MACSRSPPPGQVVLVYPVGYEQSWNAGVCCGGAELHGPSTTWRS